MFGLWVWLFPISQVLHGFEESWQGYGFHIWLRHAAQTSFSRTQTEIMHVAFVAAMLLASWAALRLERARWIVVALAVLVLLNAMSHIVGALVSSWAASGLITSVLFWLPLGVFALARGWRHLSRRHFSLGVVVGVLVQLPLTLLAALS